MGRIEHIYTIGSPLEKVRFFWPRLKPEQNLVGERDLPWDNFVSYFDPVAGKLRRYTEWGPVTNHYLLGGGFVSGHVAYERSPVFLKTFTEGLLGERRTIRRTIGQKLEDIMLLLGETLLGPLGLLMLLIMGFGSFLLVVLFVPFLVSLPFRWFFSPEIWGPILDYCSLVILALMVMIFLWYVPAMNAKRILRPLRRDN